MEKESNLHWAHLGNGITVWDPNIYDDRTRDAKIVAHISIDRTIELKIPVSPSHFDEILNIAMNEDPNVSITQDQKVFTELAKDVISVIVINKFKSKKDKYYKCIRIK